MSCIYNLITASKWTRFYSQLGKGKVPTNSGKGVGIGFRWCGFWCLFCWDTKHDDAKKLFIWNVRFLLNVIRWIGCALLPPIFFVQYFTIWEVSRDDVREEKYFYKGVIAKYISAPGQKVYTPTEASTSLESVSATLLSKITVLPAIPLIILWDSRCLECKQLRYFYK